MPNIDDYWFRYKSACEIEGQKLEYISKQALTELIAEIISSPVEPEVSDANSVHIDNIYNLIDACFTETYDDIRRHAPDNQILIANYLRATKIKLINAISYL